MFLLLFIELVALLTIGVLLVFKEMSPRDESLGPLVHVEVSVALRHAIDVSCVHQRYVSNLLELLISEELDPHFSLLRKSNWAVLSQVLDLFGREH